MGGRKMGEVALEPPTQVGDQLQFLLRGGVGVPVFGEPPGKPADMGAQGADVPLVMRGKLTWGYWHGGDLEIVALVCPGMTHLCRPHDA